jgi:chlorite dismutase
VRSYEWYILPDEGAEPCWLDHGRKKRRGAISQVAHRANTVASFLLGDYRWILALEALARSTSST